MRYLCRIDILIKLKRELNKEIWILPQRRRVREGGMAVSTKLEQFLLNQFKRGLNLQERENLWNIRKGFEILFVSNPGRENPEGFT